jgi:hypothetical protein
VPDARLLSTRHSCQVWAGMAATNCRGRTRTRRPAPTRRRQRELRTSPENGANSARLAPDRHRVGRALSLFAMNAPLATQVSCILLVVLVACGTRMPNKRSENVTSDYAWYDAIRTNCKKGDLDACLMWFEMKHYAATNPASIPDGVLPLLDRDGPAILQHATTISHEARDRLMPGKCHEGIGCAFSAREYDYIRLRNIQLRAIIRELLIKSSMTGAVEAAREHCTQGDLAGCLDLIRVKPRTLHDCPVRWNRRSNQLDKSHTHEDASHRSSSKSGDQPFIMGIFLTPAMASDVPPKPPEELDRKLLEAQQRAAKRHETQSKRSYPQLDIDMSDMFSRREHSSLRELCVKPANPWHQDDRIHSAMSCYILATIENNPDSAYLPACTAGVPEGCLKLGKALLQESTGAATQEVNRVKDALRVALRDPAGTAFIRTSSPSSDPDLAALRTLTLELIKIIPFSTDEKYWILSFNCKFFNSACDTFEEHVALHGDLLCSAVKDVPASSSPMKPQANYE